jgi:UDP:flavonoid glycosyltransferase YjiC (YdhE family)
MGLFRYLWPTSNSAETSDTNPVIEAKRRWRFNDNIRLLNDARALFRLPPVAADPLDHPLLGDLFMVRSTPTLDAYLDTVPDRVCSVGPCLHEPHDRRDADAADLREHLADSDRPVVFVQQARTFNAAGFWQQAVEAYRDADIQVVASVGRSGVPLGDLPPNFYVRPHISPRIALARADAMLASATSSAVLGALTSGIPSVVASTGGETPDNCEHLVDSGCAVQLPEGDVSADVIRELTFDVLHDHYMRANCHWAARLLAPAESCVLAADAVENMMSSALPRADRVHPATISS